MGIPRLAFVAALFLSIALVNHAAARQVAWNESVQGDLSSDRFNPTHITLDEEATYWMRATTSSADPEYVTITIPSGLELQAINHVAWTSTDRVAFIALQSGTTFTEPAIGPDPANMLGWTHFGPGLTLGKDLLGIMAQQKGTIGFPVPLPAGDYTFWLNQTDDSGSTYELEFVVIPSAATISLAVVPAACALRRRRHFDEVG